MRVFRSLAAFFGVIHEKVFAHYFKTFSLGVRRRAVAVSVLAVLLAGLNPCYAEFGNADSQNLSQINQKLTTVNSWLSSLAQKLDHLSVIENTLKQASAHLYNIMNRTSLIEDVYKRQRLRRVWRLIRTLRSLAWQLRRLFLPFI